MMGDAMSTELRDFLTHAVSYFATEGRDNPNLGDAQSILSKYSKFVAIEGEMIGLIVTYGRFKPIRPLLKATT